MVVDGDGEERALGSTWNEAFSEPLSRIVRQRRQAREKMLGRCSGNTFTPRHGLSRPVLSFSLVQCCASQRLASAVTEVGWPLQSVATSDWDSPMVTDVSRDGLLAGILTTVH